MPLDSLCTRIQTRVPASLVERRLVAVDSGHARCLAVYGCIEREASRVATQIEDTVMRGHELRQSMSVVALVAEEACLVPAGKVDFVADPVLRHSLFADE